MGVDLLKHNQEAYEKVQKAISEGKKKIAISHATGTGKSYLIAKLFEDYNNDKKLVLVPSTYTSDQIQVLFEKYHIQNVDIMRYQKLIKMSNEDIAAMDYSVIALDEYHHDTSKVWGEKVRKLIDTHPEAIIFGTSVTPIRSDGVNAIDELFEGNCVSDLHLSESIAKKIVPLPKYVGALYTLDDELEKLRKKVENATNTKEEKQEFYKKINTMCSQIEKSYGMPIIFNKNIKDREGKYIIFCKNKKHLVKIKDTVIGWFETAGFKNINAYEVYSDYENKDAEYKAFCDDTNHNLKLLFCVNMLNEGLHLENISGVLLLRPTRSMIVFLQQIGRAIEANNVNTPVIIDAVNNFSAIGQGMKLLGEIKEAVAKEKESDPNFNDSGFIDIDTFFVVEQVVEIQKMFREIEGRLQGSWDLYIKALKQYKEREWDCDVPDKHIEIVDGVKVLLGQWCNHIIGARNGRNRYLITREREKQLNQLGFIWDVYKYRFNNNIEAVAKYLKMYGKYPSNKSKDANIQKLGRFLNMEKMKLRNEKEKYPEWKREIIKKYIPDFSSETRHNKSFNEFLYYVKLYKERYGHTDIKKNYIIDSFKIGTRLDTVKNMYKSGVLSEEEINLLNNLGVCTGSKYKKEYCKKIELVKQAVRQGVFISESNKCYMGVNLYNWINNHKKRFSNEELKIINQVMPPKNIPIKVTDMKKHVCREYVSISEAGRALHNEFNVVESDNKGIRAISNRLTGIIKNPVYKDRFRFEYVDDRVS